ncbi:low affinity iron permease family protein [Streptacidiphilus griseoplanus]|uniref:low affinity iron permease family protein n=1 Tax=Peterkaempfera griseoplana TaxID=66896 RepID=UPI0006E45F3C|nr:low affinity iron permease family protein [Peterkaempfera griseoplana]
MTFRHPAERGGTRRGAFERFAELASNFTSSPAFSVFCVLLVGAFVAVHVLRLPVEWQLAAGDAMTAVTLLLLALLKNAERRAEHTVQRKLNALAAALLAQQSGDHDTARTELEQAIGMEEKI